MCYDEYEEHLLSLLVDRFKSKKVDFIDFFFTGNFHVKSLLRQGFVDCDDKLYRDIPMLFSPLDRDKKEITWAIYSSNYGDSKHSFTDKNNWYITKGDGDQDRPNFF